MASKFVEMQYDSDDGLAYNISMTRLRAAASGLAAANALNSLYPHKWHPRVVHGTDSTGLKHASLPVPAGSALFTGSTNTFTYGGTTYAVTGRTGEKRPNLAPLV